MGISSDGQLNYGIPFEEEFEFPWSVYDNAEIDDWWKVENGYVAKHHCFTADGEWAIGYSRDGPEWDEERNHYDLWLKENPLPIALTIYCSFDYPMYLISTPKYGFSVCRGYAEKIVLPNLVSLEKETIIDFCNKYKIEMPCEPDWYLTSLYG